MRLTVIGSGDASNAGGRLHSCYWLDGAGRAPIMVDFGGTALAGLRMRGRSPLELGGLLFTHLHGDHVGGFPYLYVDAAYTTVRAAPLEVLGPAGTEPRLRGLLGLAYGKLAERPVGFETRWAELLPGEERELLGARVQGFAADHQDPPERPLCLRVTGLDGRVVAFSGDTRMCEGLLRAAEGADLLVAECTGLRPPCGNHCSWEEWRAALPKIGARRVLLTHLGEEVRARTVELARERPGGPPFGFAEDGLVLEV